MTGLPGSPATSGGGYYSAIVNYGWSDMVTPVKTGYTFTPPSRSYSNVTSDQTNQDYTATPETYTISGRITCEGSGLDGVIMNGLPGNPATSGGGYYSVAVSACGGWSGTVTPTKTGYTFIPPSGSYSNVTSDQTNQDYTATANEYPLAITIVGNGTVANPDQPTYHYGDTVQLDANAAAGWSFSGWSGDASGSDNPIMIIIDEDPNVTAIFQILTYTVTASAGANGTVEPTNIVVNYGSNQDFNAIPNISYEVNEWFLDGNSVQTGQHTLSDVRADHTLYVAFKELDFVIYGYVVEIDGNTPVEGVLISTEYNDINAVTDANGYYELWVDYGWDGNVAPQKEGYVFEPNNYAYADVNNDYNDMNYTATMMTFMIAGYVFEKDLVTPIIDVNVCAENGGGQWTSRYDEGCGITDANGYYEVIVDYNWSGSVTPIKYAFAFDEPNIVYTNVLADQNDQNYIGWPLTFAISGYINNECNAPIEGVRVDANNGGPQYKTDVNGFYQVWVGYNWSGAVTPIKKYYTFEPNQNLYVDILADQYDQNYIAVNIYDLDCDGFIGFGDMGEIANNWLLPGPEGDFNVDDIVNFLDFAEFGIVWGDEEK